MLPARVPEKRRAPLRLESSPLEFRPRLNDVEESVRERRIIRHNKIMLIWNYVYLPASSGCQEIKCCLVV